MKVIFPYYSDKLLILYHMDWDLGRSLFDCLFPCPYLAIKLQLLLVNYYIVFSYDLEHKLLYRLIQSSVCSLLWRDSLWGQCLNFILTLGMLFPSLKTSQPTIQPVSLVNLPIYFQLLFTTTCIAFKVPLSLNFSMFCCKWSHFLWRRLGTICFKACFFSQTKSLCHSSGAGVGT